MNVEAVLQAYRVGRRNFQGECLRGLSFEGEDLRGADFSFTDIRSTDFSEANLIETNFTGAVAGLSNHWSVILLCASFMLIALADVGVTFIGIIVISTFGQKFTEDFGYVPAFIVSLLLVIFFMTFLTRGIVAAIGALAAMVAIAVPIGALTGPILAGTGSIAFVAALMPCTTLILAIGTVIFFSLAKDENRFLRRSIVGINFLCFFGFGSVAWSIAKFITDRSDGAFEKSLNIAESGDLTTLKIGLTFVAISISLTVITLGIYSGLQANKKDDRFSLVTKIVVWLNTTFGTSFSEAILTNAIFQSAVLRNTNLQAKDLTHVFWQGVQRLEFTKLPSGYLENRNIFNLVTTGNGELQNFDRLDLSGLNLTKAKLSKASFIGTNLNYTILHGASLQDALLVQTQLDGTDLSDVTLTGACIQDWGITSSTKINSIKCRWIYMQLEQYEGKSYLNYRKPDDINTEFKEGQFAEFFKILVGTLDLYHERGINPRAVAVSLKRLMSNNLATNLELMMVEKCGKNNDKLLLRVKAKDSADLSKLSKEYFAIYNRLREMDSNSPELMISASDAKVRGLLLMIVGLSSNLHNKINDSIQKLSNSNLKNALINVSMTLEKTSLTKEDKSILLDQVKLLTEVAISPNAHSKSDVKNILRILNSLKNNLPPYHSLVDPINILFQESLRLYNL